MRVVQHCAAGDCDCGGDRIPVAIVLDRTEGQPQRVRRFLVRETKRGLPGAERRCVECRLLAELRGEATVAGEVHNEKLERLLLQRGLVEPGISDEVYEKVCASAGLYYALLNAVLAANNLTAESQKLTRRSFRPRS